LKNKYKCFANRAGYNPKNAKIRREALSTLAQFEVGSAGQARALEDLARFDAEELNGTKEAVWTGSDGQIAAAQDTVAQLDQKIENLTHRLQVSFMSDTCSLIRHVGQLSVR